MLRKKLILVGDTEVGKTSLVARWVNGTFSDKYLTTIGVKIDKKTLRVNSDELALLIWDLQGGSEITGQFEAYTHGAQCCLFVADGTRAKTLQYILKLRFQLPRELVNIPIALAINKKDRTEDWQISPDDLLNLKKENWTVFMTSAKSGDGVESVFRNLSERMLHPDRRERSDF